MRNSLKVGDVVELKSDSFPKMTVISIKEGNVTTSWYNSTKKRFIKEIFPIKAVIKSKSEEQIVITGMEIK